MIELSFSRIAEPKSLTLYHAYTPGCSYCFAPGEFVDGRAPDALNDVYRFTSGGDKIDFAREVCDPFGNKWCQHSKATAHLTMGCQTTVGATNGVYAHLSPSYPIRVTDFGAASAPNTWGAPDALPKTYQHSASVIGGARFVQNIVAYTRCTGLGESQGVIGLDRPSYHTVNILVDQGQKTAYVCLYAQYATRSIPGAAHGPVIVFSMSVKFSRDTATGFPAHFHSCWISMRVWNDVVDSYQRHGCYAWDPITASWLLVSPANVAGVSTTVGRSSSGVKAANWLVSVDPQFGKLTTPESCFGAMEHFLRRIVPIQCGYAYAAMTPAILAVRGESQSITVGAGGPTYEQRQAARDEAIKVLGVMPIAASTYVGKGLTSVHEWNSLGNEAIDNMASFSSNALAYAADLRKVGDSIKTLIELAENPTDPKAWASLWLSSRFGDKLTARDTRELMNAISAATRELANAQFFQTSHSRDLNPIENIPRSIWTSGIRYNWYKVYYWPRDYVPIMKKVRELMEWDAWPSLENTWDMIPLSFVVDWLFNVSELLASIDRCIYKMYISVVSVLKTEKDVFACNLDYLNSHLKLSVADQATCSVYLRRRASYLDYEPLTWSVGSPSAINLVDAATLLIQHG